VPPVAVICHDVTLLPRVTNCGNAAGGWPSRRSWKTNIPPKAAGFRQLTQLNKECLAQSRKGAKFFEKESSFFLCALAALREDFLMIEN
jgi:hypothetical protein